jgi:hypothetical protein
LCGSVLVSKIARNQCWALNRRIRWLDSKRSERQSRGEPHSAKFLLSGILTTTGGRAGILHHAGPFGGKISSAGGFRFRPYRSLAWKFSRSSSCCSDFVDQLRCTNAAGPQPGGGGEAVGGPANGTTRKKVAKPKIFVAVWSGTLLALVSPAKANSDLEQNRGQESV